MATRKATAKTARGSVRKATAFGRGKAKKATAAHRVMAPALPAVGGGLIVHGRGKADSRLLRDLRPAMRRAERTAADLRQALAARS